MAEFLMNLKSVADCNSMNQAIFSIDPAMIFSLNLKKY
jgi:hypothetical protein